MKLTNEEATRTATGVVCINRDGEILVVSSLKGPYTVLPKGGMEEGLSMKDNAAKELAEEAGYKARFVKTPVVDITVKYPDRVQRELYFIATHPEEVEWEESNIRERKWLSLIDAMDQLGHIQRNVVFNAVSEYYGMELDRVYNETV